MAKDQMARARKAYSQAKADPDTEALAPIHMAEAGRSLQAAEKAGDAEERLHLGYVAEKKALIAMTVAEGKMAERETAKLSTETANIVAMKREQEARIARQEAEKARLEAENARLAAQSEAARAAVAKKEAEEARLAAQMEADKAAKAKAEAETLMIELSELKARQTERGIVLTIGDVLFDFGKASLSTKADRNVKKLADFLKKYPNRNVLIEGHTDNVGPEEFNLLLSRQRADSVKDRLVGDGIDPVRITTVGYGEKYPAVSNDTAADRALNRRVEVIILNEGVQAETQFRE